MPLLQDQFQAADRLEYMGLGSSGIKSNILFPKRLIKTDTAVRKNEVSKNQKESGVDEKVRK